MLVVLDLAYFDVVCLQVYNFWSVEFSTMFNMKRTEITGSFMKYRCCAYGTGQEQEKEIFKKTEAIQAGQI